MSPGTAFSKSKQVIRRGAFALALAGMTAITPALAQDQLKVATNTPPVTATTDCSRWNEQGVILTETKCELLKGKVLDQQLSTKKKEVTAQKNEVTCLKLINDDLLNGGPKTSNLTAVPPNGKACKVAKDLGLIAG